MISRCNLLMGPLAIMLLGCASTEGWSETVTEARTERRPINVSRADRVGVTGDRVAWPRRGYKRHILSVLRYFQRRLNLEAYALDVSYVHESKPYVLDADKDTAASIHGDYTKKTAEIGIYPPLLEYYKTGRAKDIALTLAHELSHIITAREEVCQGPPSEECEDATDAIAVELVEEAPSDAYDIEPSGLKEEDSPVRAARKLDAGARVCAPSKTAREDAYTSHISRLIEYYAYQLDLSDWTINLEYMEQQKWGDSASRERWNMLTVATHTRCLDKRVVYMRLYPIMRTLYKEQNGQKIAEVLVEALTRAALRRFCKGRGQTARNAVRISSPRCCPVRRRPCVA